MAKQQKLFVHQTLKSAPRIRSFIIPNVQRTGKQLGGGSYGTVEELEVDGLICAGKKIHDTLIDPENQGAQRMVDKYYNECKLLSDLRHPHIVQFLGICFLPDSRLPVLVMELMQGSLDEFLESTVDIPLPTKVSILQDVARGLVYLHHHSPPVIHRDLSARNILLTSAMTAKIADLGNSRMVDILPGQLAQTMTQGIPGTMVYMPPEALGSSQKYGPPLDMFSFGHLALFTAIQVFPKNLLTPTYHDPYSHQVKARSELERRKKYIDTLHGRFDKNHPLVVLIMGCLEYEPVKRPTARKALERLGEMRATVYNPYSNLNRLQLEKALAEKEIEVQQIPLLISKLKKASEKGNLEEAYGAKNVQQTEVKQVSLLRSELKQLTVQKAELEGTCRAKDELLRVKETEVRQIPLLRTKLEQLTVQLEKAYRAEDDQQTVRDTEVEQTSLLKIELERLNMEKLGLGEVCKGKDEVLAAKEQEIAAKKQALSDERQRLNSLSDECATLKGRLEGKTEEILCLQAHNRTLQEEMTSKDKLLKTKEQMTNEMIALKEAELLNATTTKNHLLEAKLSEISEKNQSLTSLQQKCGLLQTQLEGEQWRNQTLEVEKSILEELCKEKDEVVAAKESEITVKDQSFDSLQQQYVSLQTQLETSKEKTQFLEVEKSGVEEVCKRQDELLAAKESEIAEKDQGFITLQQRCGLLKTQLETVERKNQSLEASRSSSEDMLAVKDSHIAALQTELSGNNKILQAKPMVHQFPSALIFNLPLKWKKLLKMPSGVSLAQVVVIGGKVYIGGGRSEGGEYKVLEYAIQTGQWRELKVPTSYFGMAEVNNQLVIAGGKNKKGNITNKVWVLDSASGTWTQPFPALPTARWCPSAVGYKRWVLVLGGYDERCVEILDTAFKQWYTATPLPSEAHRPSLTVLQSTLYVLWGCSAVSISIPMLVSDAMFQNPATDTSNGPKLTKWQQLPDTPTHWLATTTLHGSLVALGGTPASAALHMYLPQTEQWVQVAKLPAPRHYSMCALLPETEELMVIGGWKEYEYMGYNKSMDLCTL